MYILSLYKRFPKFCRTNAYIFKIHNAKRASQNLPNITHTHTQNQLVTQIKYLQNSEKNFLNFAKQTGLFFRIEKKKNAEYTR